LTKHEDKLKTLKKHENAHSWYFLCLLASTVGVTLFSSTSPIAGIFLIISLVLNYHKVSDLFKKIGILNQLLACERLNERISEVFSSRGTISTWVKDEKLLYANDGLDCLLSLDSGLDFAISIRAIIKPKKGQTRVFFHSTKKQMVYRKFKEGIRIFRGDPIQILKDKTRYISQNNPELFKGTLIQVLVFAESSNLEVYDNSPVEILDGRKYLYWDNVYIVDEASVISLIESLEKKYTQRPKRRVRSSIT
jgi:hypothetical protein